jgi:hypothetical protein
MVSVIRGNTPAIARWKTSMKVWDVLPLGVLPAELPSVETGSMKLKETPPDQRSLDV